MDCKQGKQVIANVRARSPFYECEYNQPTSFKSPKQSKWQAASLMGGKKKHALMSQETEVIKSNPSISSTMSSWEVVQLLSVQKVTSGSFHQSFTNASREKGFKLSSLSWIKASIVAWSSIAWVMDNTNVKSTKIFLIISILICLPRWEDADRVALCSHISPNGFGWQLDPFCVQRITSFIHSKCKKEGMNGTSEKPQWTTQKSW